MTVQNRQQIFSRIAGFISHALVTFCIVQVSVTWMIVCGTTVQSFAALAASLALGTFGGSFLRFPKGRSWILTQAVILAAVYWLFATLINTTFSAGISMSGDVFGLSYLVPGLVSTTCFALTLSWAIYRPSLSGPADPNSDSSHATNVPLAAAGMGAGFLLALLHGLMPFPLALTSSLLLVSGTTFRLLLRQPDTRDQTDGSAKNAPAPTAVVSMIGAGVLTRCFAELLSRQFALSASLLCTAAAMTLLLTGFLLSATGRRLLSNRFSSACCLLLLAATPLILGQTTALNLHLNAGIEGALTVVLLRALQLAALFSLTIATALSVQITFVSRETTTSTGPRPAVTTVATYLFGISLGAFMTLIDPRAGTVLGILLMATPAVMYPLLKRSDERSGKTKPAPALLSLCVCCGIVGVTLPVGGNNEMLLFTSHSAQAWRMGFALDQIAQTHSMRLLEEHLTSSGRLSVWRTSGDRIQVRRNGIPTGEASTNSFTTPQPVADTLTTILPLVVHKNANSVLLLGDDSGAGLRACADFPLHTIEAVRTDHAATDIASRTVWEQMDPTPKDDDRITISHAAPAAAVRRKSDTRFDVIASDNPPPVSAAAQSCYTYEYYVAAKKKLNPDGVFCQRMTVHEFGSDLLLRSLSSLVQLYDRVVIVRMAPGELAFVAGGTELLDAGLLKRMQKSHVNAALARSGWDWSQVAALPVVDTGDPFGILEHIQKRHSSTAANGFYAFALPNEMVRQGNKAAEIKAAFAPHQQRLADAVPQGPAYNEFARRFSAVVQQAEILTAFPDIPWPYRKSLKMEMQRNPRAPIESVSNGQIVRNSHPLDEHRKDYFLTLSAVVNQAKSGTVDPRLLRKLSGFTLTYEPLLSHFAHHELIRVHESTDHPSPAMELRHRLYTVYFTEPKDLSVRQVTAAIQQILDDPELLPGEAERFDHVNSMLQELVRRWEGRRGADPASARRTQRDVDVCMQVANRALSAMEDWAPELQISPEQIRLRRRFVNMKLVAPLREYREQILAHRIRSEVRPAEPELTPNDDELPLLLDPKSMVTN